MASIKTRATRSPAIPDVPRDLDPDLKRTLDAQKEALDVFLGRRGAPLDKAVTFRDLVDSGIAKLTISDLSGTRNPVIIEPGNQSDLAIPPAPTGVSAAGAFTNIIIEWDAPGYRNHRYAEILRNTEDVVGNAIVIAAAPGRVYADPVGPGKTYYYWVRFVSRADIRGPVNATAGVQASTASDAVFELVEDMIDESMLVQSLRDRITLIDAPSTNALSVNARILAEANARAAAILAEANARANGDSNLQTQIDTIVAGTTGDLQDVLAAIQTEQVARTNADNAEAAARETLATQIRGAYTGTDPAALTTGLIYNERQARISALNAEVSARQALEATVINNNNTLSAAITNEASARANADAALATQISTISASAGITTYRQPTAPTGTINTGSLWFDTDDNNRAYRWNGSAWEPTDDARIGQNQAAITNESTARANADTALSQSLTTLSAVANAKNRTYRQPNPPAAPLVEGDVWFDTDDGNKSYRWSGASWDATDDTRIAANQSAITNLSTTVANGDSALAQQITQLSATTQNNLTVAIQQEATARANADGQLFAQYTVKIDSNGRVAGFGLASEPATLNSTTFTFAVIADRFFIAPPGPGGFGSSPFVHFTTPQVVNGVTVPAGTYITNAFIQNGAITNAKIGNLAVDDAKIANISASKITTGILNTSLIDIDGITLRNLDGKLAINGVDWETHVGGPGKPESGATRNNWRGSWASGVLYTRGDSVAYDGSSYTCTVSHISDGVSRPPNASFWGLLAAAGSIAPTGLSTPMGFTASNVLTMLIPAGQSRTLRGQVRLSNPTGSGTLQVQLFYRLVGATTYTQSNGPTESFFASEPSIYNHSVTITNTGADAIYEVYGQVSRSSTSSGPVEVGRSFVTI